MTTAENLLQELRGKVITFNGDAVSLQHFCREVGPVQVNISCDFVIANPTTKSRWWARWWVKKVVPLDIIPDRVLIHITCIDVADGLLRGAEIMVAGTRTSGKEAAVRVTLDRNQSIMIEGIQRTAALSITFV